MLKEVKDCHKIQYTYFGGLKPRGNFPCNFVQALAKNPTYILSESYLRKFYKTPIKYVTGVEKPLKMGIKPLHFKGVFVV